MLVDCGLGPRELAERLALRGLEVSAIDLILVTHEHGDHSAGVARAAQRAGCPIVCTSGTRLAMGEALMGLPGVLALPAGAEFELEGLQIGLIAVPHDAREPVAVRFSAGRHCLAVVTDLGHVSAHLVEALQDLDGLFLEFNHDLEMLQTGPYSPALKARVGGEYGHLSNTQAAGLVTRVIGPRLQQLVAAHLSQVNNSEARVRESLAGLSWGGTSFQIASQPDGVGWTSLE